MNIGKKEKNQCHFILVLTYLLVDQQTGDQKQFG